MSLERAGSLPSLGVVHLAFSWLSTLSEVSRKVVGRGGLACSRMLTDWITERTTWIATVAVYPGEDEMQALAERALRVLDGEEQAKVYWAPRACYDTEGGVFSGVNFAADFADYADSERKQDNNREIYYFYALNPRNPRR